MNFLDAFKRFAQGKGVHIDMPTQYDELPRTGQCLNSGTHERFDVYGIDTISDLATLRDKFGYYKQNGAQFVMVCAACEADWN